MADTTEIIDYFGYWQGESLRTAITTFHDETDFFFYRGNKQSAAMGWINFFIGMFTVCLFIQSNSIELFQLSS